MPSKLLFVLLGTTFFSMSAMAGLSEAVSAYEKGQYEQALEEFTYLSDEKNPEALYYMGQMYMNGQGVERDGTKAMKYFEEAHALGHTQAQTALARLVFYDDTIENNKEIGLEYLKEAAYNGDAEALYELGEIYQNGNGVDKEYTYAFGYYLMAAMKGDKKAQHRLAFSYLDGRGTTQDFESGIKWLARSANQGYVLAQKDLADLQSSDSRLVNLPDAYAWYSIIAAYNTDEIGSEAASRRDEIAEKLKQKNDILIGRQRAARNWRPIRPEQSVSKEDLLTIPTPIIPGFNDETSVQKRLEAGFVLYSDGSKFGVTPAMLEEAVKTDNISEISKRVEEAVKNGALLAYAYLGDLMRTRFNDDKAAVEWYAKGANKGDAYAQYQLANMYCEGRGVEAANAMECYKWLIAASKTQDEVLKKTVDYAMTVVEGQATPEELEAARTAAQTVEKEKAQTKKESEQSGGFNFF